MLKMLKCSFIFVALPSKVHLRLVQARAVWCILHRMQINQIISI